MNECDKMLSCLGFNETAVKNYGNTIPFSSRKVAIMNRINQAARLEAAGTPDLSALLYILSIAFSVMMVRFIVFAQTGDATVLTVFASIVIRYSQQLQTSMNAMSVLFSVVICAGTGWMIYYLKNKKQYC